MDVNNINPVITAFTSILPQIGFQTVERIGLSAAAATLQNKGVIINIGVVGTLKGTIVIDMDIENAKKFASKMMMGMPVPVFDNLPQSALCEMSNMVCANACTNFAQIGIKGLNISPPSMIVGKDSFLKFSAPAIVIINFLADGIAVNLCLGLFK